MKLIPILFLFFIFTNTINAQMTFNRADASDLVSRFEKDGFITKIDFEKDEVQVNGFMWSTIKLDLKRTFINLMASHHGYEEGLRHMPATDILDDKSGKKLGYYSIVFGAKVVTESR